MRVSVFVVAGAVVALRAVVACDEEYKECYPGDFLGCSCKDGAFGYAACSAAGNFTSSTCVCDGTTPGIDGGTTDASEDADGGAALDGAACVPDSGSKKYAEACVANEECETCRCETFAGTRVCTTTCTSLEQCPAPSDACTNRGVCRPPL